VNETRAQFAYGDLHAPPTDLIGPAVNITSVATFGTLSSSPTRRVNRMVQIADNLSHQAGAHALRAGVDLLFNDTTITFPRSYRGNYSFSSLANFLSGAYSGFTQTFGDPRVSQTNPNIGLYAQDEWRVRPGVTLNLGLRYDLQFLYTVNTDTNNVSPRVGFAWSPANSQDLVVRGSAGLFFDRVPLRAVANARSSVQSPAPSWRGENAVASPVSSSTRVTRAPRSSAARSPSSAGAASPATRTASALEVAWRVAAGRRWPDRVSASVSNGGWSSSMPKPCSRARPPSARLAAAVISGPIP